MSMSFGEIIQIPLRLYTKIVMGPRKRCPHSKCGLNTPSVSILYLHLQIGLSLVSTGL